MTKFEILVLPHFVIFHFGMFVCCLLEFCSDLIRDRNGINTVGLVGMRVGVKGRGTINRIYDIGE